MRWGRIDFIRVPPLCIGRSPPAKTSRVPTVLAYAGPHYIVSCVVGKLAHGYHQSILRGPSRGESSGPTFFTFDVDSLSASECCSGGLPEGFGMTWRQVYEIIRTLSAAGNVRLVGADVMEFTPVYPSGHRDGVMAAMVGWELLCWLARVVAERNGEWRRTR